MYLASIEGGHKYNIHAKKLSLKKLSMQKNLYTLKRTEIRK